MTNARTHTQLPLLFRTLEQAIWVDDFQKKWIDGWWSKLLPVLQFLGRLCQEMVLLESYVHVGITFDTSEYLWNLCSFFLLILDIPHLAFIFCWTLNIPCLHTYGGHQDTEPMPRVSFLTAFRNGGKELTFVDNLGLSWETWLTCAKE